MSPSRRPGNARAYMDRMMGPRNGTRAGRAARARDAKPRTAVASRHGQRRGGASREGGAPTGGGGQASRPTAKPHGKGAERARRGRGKPSRTDGAHGREHGHGAMRRDGDIAPYRQAAGEGVRRWGGKPSRGRGGTARVRDAKPHGRCAREGVTATGRCGAMGTSRPTAKPRERGTAMGRGKPSRTGAGRSSGAHGRAIRLDEGNIVWLDGER